MVLLKRSSWSSRARASLFRLRFFLYLYLFSLRERVYFGQAAVLAKNPRLVPMWGVMGPNGARQIERTGHPSFPASHRRETSRLFVGFVSIGSCRLILSACRAGPPALPMVPNAAASSDDHTGHPFICYISLPFIFSSFLLLFCSSVLCQGFFWSRFPRTLFQRE